MLLFNTAPRIIATTLLFHDSVGWLGRDVRGSISIAFSLAVSHVLVVKMMSGFRVQYLSLSGESGFLTCWFKDPREERWKLQALLTP